MWIWRDEVFEEFYIWRILTYFEEYLGHFNQVVYEKFEEVLFFEDSLKMTCKSFLLKK